LGQGRIIGPRPATPRINPIGSCRVQLSGHLSGKDAVGPPLAIFACFNRNVSEDAMPDETPSKTDLFEIMRISRSMRAA